MESKVTFKTPYFNANSKGSATQTLSISCKRVYRMHVRSCVWLYTFLNRLNEIHANSTLNHWMNREMVSCFVRVHLVYFPHKSVNGQALANFLVYHPSLEIKPEKDVELGIYEVERQAWVLKFDGSSTEKFVGAGIVII